MKDSRSIKDKTAVNSAFNEMPFEHRKIAANAELVSRIQDLLLLKKRVTDNFNREIKYIDERIKNYNNGIDHSPKTQK